MKTSPGGSATPMIASAPRENLSAELAAAPVTVIRPASGWGLVDVGELWRFRELAGILMWRDIKVRYKQTALGAAWALLQPLAMMVVFTVMFGLLAGVPTGGLPYPLLIYSGLLPWNLFAATLNSAGYSVVGNERLITKIYFPRLLIPFSSAGPALIDFAIAFLLLLGMMAYFGYAPGPGLLLVPVVCGLIVLAALGLGTFLAAVNVTYRDVRYIVPFLVQLGFFATPTIYMQPEAALPPATAATTPAADTAPTTTTTGPGDARGRLTDSRLRVLLDLNPMNALVATFRAATLGGPIPWARLGAVALATAAAFVLGCLYFRRTEDGFADII